MPVFFLLLPAAFAMRDSLLKDAHGDSGVIVDDRKSDKETPHQNKPSLSVEALTGALFDSAKSPPWTSIGELTRRALTDDERRQCLREVAEALRAESDRENNLTSQSERRLARDEEIEQLRKIEERLESLSFERADAEQASPDGQTKNVEEKPRGIYNNSVKEQIEALEVFQQPARLRQEPHKRSLLDDDEYTEVERAAIERFAKREMGVAPDALPDVAAAVKLLYGTKLEFERLWQNVKPYNPKAEGANKYERYVAHFAQELLPLAKTGHLTTQIVKARFGPTYVTMFGNALNPEENRHAEGLKEKYFRSYSEKFKDSPGVTDVIDCAFDADAHRKARQLLELPPASDPVFQRRSPKHNQADSTVSDVEPGQRQRGSRRR